MKKLINIMCIWFVVINISMVIIEVKFLPPASCGCPSHAIPLHAVLLFLTIVAILINNIN